MPDHSGFQCFILWLCFTISGRDCFSHLTHNPQEACSHPPNLIYSQGIPAGCGCILSAPGAPGGFVAAVGPSLSACPIPLAEGSQGSGCERSRKPRNSSAMEANAIKKPWSPCSAPAGVAALDKGFFPCGQGVWKSWKSGLVSEELTELQSSTRSGLGSSLSQLLTRGNAGLLPWDIILQHCFYFSDLTWSSTEWDRKLHLKDKRGKKISGGCIAS